jgi:hypothetical protein
MFMSDSEFLAARTTSLAAKPAAEVKAEAKPEAVVSDAKAAVESQAEAETAEIQGDFSKTAPDPKAVEAEPKDVLSKVDLSELSDEDIRELAEKGKSGLLKRIAELTAKRKIAEEKAAQLEARMQQQPVQLEGKPAELPENIAKVSTVEDLNKLYQASNDYIEWAEDTLFTNDHLGADDVVAEHEGKPYTKKDVKALLSVARKNRDKHLPARLRQLQEAEQRQVQKAAYTAQMRKELPWMEGEDNDLRRQFESLNKSPVLEKIRQSVPEAEPILDYMVGHAVNSAYGRREIKDTAFQQPSPRINPPAITPGSSAQSERPAAKDAKQAKDIQQRFRSTGSERDFLAARTAQIAQRKPLKIA